MSLVGRRLRIGAAWTREHDAFDCSRSAERARAWTRLDLGDRWGLVVAALAEPGARSVRAGVSFHP